MGKGAAVRAPFSVFGGILRGSRMTKLVSGDGRTHIQSRLMRESLQDRNVLSKTDSERDLQIFPDVSLVSIGGQSIFDRGKDAILPLVQELVAIKRDLKEKMVIGVG